MQVWFTENLHLTKIILGEHRLIDSKLFFWFPTQDARKYALKLNI
jgi:hypothetical protein